MEDSKAHLVLVNERNAEFEYGTRAVLVTDSEETLESDMDRLAASWRGDHQPDGSNEYWCGGTCVWVSSIKSVEIDHLPILTHYLPVFRYEKETTVETTEKHPAIYLTPASSVKVEQFTAIVEGVGTETYLRFTHPAHPECDCWAKVLESGIASPGGWQDVTDEAEIMALEEAYEQVSE